MSNNLYLPWPYAAKSIIEYELDGDVLSVWITFREPMNQTLVPAVDKWIFKCDTTEYMPATTVWQDAYTLLCTVETVSPFTKLTLKYVGPGPTTYARNDPARKTLETTYGKQWESWGPIRCHNLAA